MDIVIAASLSERMNALDSTQEEPSQKALEVHGTCLVSRCALVVKDDIPKATAVPMLPSWMLNMQQLSREMHP